MTRPSVLPRPRCSRPSLPLSASQREEGSPMTMLSREQLAALPRTFLDDAVQGLDLTTETGRTAARLRVATDLARCLKAATLLKACRANGIRHITAGHQAAHALASLAVPALPSAEGRH